MVDAQTTQTNGSFTANEQIKTIGYNFDKNMEQNIEMLIEQAKMLLNGMLLSQSTISAVNNPLIASYMYGTDAKDNISDTKPAASYILRASSLLDNLLLKAPDFEHRDDWIKENKNYQKEIFAHLQNVEELYGICDQLKDLALKLAKRLGMTDTNIKIKRWEYFL